MILAIKIISVFVILCVLGFIYGYAMWLAYRADLCYRRIEIAEMALLKANRSEHNRIKIYRLIDRAQRASFNRSTQAMVNRLMERYNAKFNQTSYGYVEENVELA